MDLESLVLAYDGAKRQVDVLDQCLADLLQRRPEALESREELEQDFDYLRFKIDVLNGVKHMYEEYRDWKWTQLQHESAKSLQELLNSEATPAESADMETDHIPMEDEDEFGEENLLVHMIPVPLAPLQEDSDSWGELGISVLGMEESMDVETLGWMGDISRD